MTDNYTPNTDYFRSVYPDDPREFDRWLRKVKAEAWGEGHKRGIGSYSDVVPLNPYL